jgi:hypothetical protein
MNGAKTESRSHIKSIKENTEDTYMEDTYMVDTYMVDTYMVDKSTDMVGTNVDRVDINTDSGGTNTDRVDTNTDMVGTNTDQVDTNVDMKDTKADKDASKLVKNLNVPKFYSKIYAITEMNNLTSFNFFCFEGWRQLKEKETGNWKEAQSGQDKDRQKETDKEREKKQKKYHLSFTVLPIY